MRSDASPGDRVTLSDGRKGTILSRAYDGWAPAYNVSLDGGPERIFMAVLLNEENPLEVLARLSKELYGEAE